MTKWIRVVALLGGVVVPTTIAAATVSATVEMSPALADGSTTVTYQGHRIDVPSGWTVYDLKAAPQTCVRFDRHAIYLGTPGSDQDCPAHAVGRTEAILVRPDGTVTASYGQHRETVQRIVDHAGLAWNGQEPDDSPAGPSSAPASPAGPDGSEGPGTPAGASDGARYPAGSAARGFNGSGFDTCAAPSASTMKAWLRSSYRMVGVYIGGRNRACGYGNLGSAWVNSVSAMGWRLLPIYVGSQAPCAFQRGLASIPASKAAAQGRSEALDAVRRAGRLGMYPGSALYFDLEGYSNDSSCRTTVRTFLDSWTRALHGKGYLSGVYSSAASGIADLAKAYTAKSHSRPDAIWIGHWDNKASVWSDKFVPNSYWHVGQRVKQYRGPHKESYGGHAIEIDSNVARGPVASVKRTFRVTSKAGIRARTGPGTRYSASKTYASGTRLGTLCQAEGSKVGRTRVWDRLANGLYVSDAYLSTSSSTGYTSALPRCANPFQVWGAGLHVRSGPSTSHRVVATIPLGGLAYVRCQTKGSKAEGSTYWDNLGRGWAADGYTLAPGRPGRTSAIPTCVSAPPLAETPPTPQTPAP